jgi:AhpD family alkylhydroperoxidase
MNSKDLLRELRSDALVLSKAAPDVMQAFQGIMKVASKEGALSSKIKELMALAIAISGRCEGCIVFHVHNAIRHHATREEVVDTISVAIEMGGGPSAVYGGKALSAFDQLKE